MALQPTSDLIFKIATAEIVDKARLSGTFTGMPVDAADGYIHFSTAAQLRETLEKHFSGQSGLVLMAIRPQSVAPTLRWEPSRGGALFPHVYGTFAMSALVHEALIDVAADGTVTLPEWVR